MRTKAISDWLWLRVLDVPGALAGARYEGEGELVLEVVDRFRPSAGGRFRLEAGPEEQPASRPTRRPHLTLGAAELGAVYLGGVAPSLLAEAGRIDEHARDALARADALFTTRKLPFSNTGSRYVAEPESSTRCCSACLAGVRGRGSAGALLDRAACWSVDKVAADGGVDQLA